MTEPNPPPFDACAGAPVPPPPLAALGAVPMAALAYSTPTRVGRPGVLTAVGVTSIVVAGLGVFFNASFGLQAFGFYIMSSLSAPATLPPPLPTTAPVAATGGTGVLTSTGSYTTTWTFSTSGGPPPVPAATTQPAGAFPAGGTALTPAEVQSVMAKVQARVPAGSALTAAQVSALQTALQDPAAPLVMPGTAWAPVNGLLVDADGSATIQLSGGVIVLDPQGQVTYKTSSVAAAAAFTAGGGPRVSGRACALVALEAAASLALCVVLLIAGIAVFRSSPRAAGLHRLYARVKLPLAFVGAAALPWMYGSFMSSVTAGFGGTASPASATMRTYLIGWGVGLLVWSAAYPVVLMIVFRRRSVREYYQSVSGARR